MTIHRPRQITYGRQGGAPLVAALCEDCMGEWVSPLCPSCESVGYVGVDPHAGPTNAIPGSAAKIAVLSARYRAGVELFHSGDFCERDNPHARIQHPDPAGVDDGDDWDDADFED